MSITSFGYKQLPTHPPSKACPLKHGRFLLAWSLTAIECRMAANSNRQLSSAHQPQRLVGGVERRAVAFARSCRYARAEPIEGLGNVIEFAKASGHAPHTLHKLGSARSGGRVG